MFDALPEQLIALFIFVFGIIIGSFLNVVIYRLHTGKSLGGGSHCLSCGHHLAWYELIPLCSYIVLGARCRLCDSKIPSRYFLVELLTGLLFLTVAMTIEGIVATILSLILVAFLVVIVVYDLYHMIIPNEFTIGVTVVSVAYLILLWVSTRDITVVGMSLLAGAVSFFFFASLWKYSEGRWIGFGDVKLSFPLGILVGFPGFFSMIVLSFWIGALVSLSIIGVQRLMRGGKVDLRMLGRKLTIKSEVPFAPFLIAGFIAVFFLHANVLQLLTYVL